MPSPTNRVLALLELLQNADEIPGSELAHQLEVDSRTLRRYITRLQNMGVPSFNIATSVSLIIAQRLARRLCTHCKLAAEPLPEKVLIEEGFHNIDIPGDQLRIFEPVGCKLCSRGYKGRTGVYEVLRITPALSRIIMEGGNAIDIIDQARQEGFRTLRQSALKKVAAGFTSLQEANRVTKD